MKIPRILLTAGASGSGKTMLTCGLLQALVDRNKDVASFKCGPDYIDPMFHSRVIGTSSCNLDTFFTDKETTQYLLCEHGKDKDICVMEGVMGFYDGLAGISVMASAYDLAVTTKTPAVLIVNSRGMSVSLAAYIKGFLEYMPDNPIKGVIFNQMSEMLYPRMKKMIEDQLPVRVLGYVPRLTEGILESRHLGLVLPDEVEGLRDTLKDLASIMEKTVDIDGLLQLAGEAPEIDCDEQELLKKKPVLSFRTKEKVRIGVASDEAFCFFYEDNFRLLQKMGAELIYFSPIHDRHLPEGLDGLLLYGGYPELYAKELSENSTMLSDIRNAISGNMPVMAECGGFMYLHRKMEDTEGNSYEMAGVIDGEVRHTHKLSRFGYVTLQGGDTEVFGTPFTWEIPAHEFHYFDSSSCGECFFAKKPLSKRGWNCIHAGRTMLAGFPHLYYYGAPEVPAAFLKACEAYGLEKK
ncbi:MAG: cobyrinate a,c-diamide synthase [Blautia sp.]|nr:cobyrinate a,c-diamide synthase [Blautia sp.]